MRIIDELDRAEVAQLLLETYDKHKHCFLHGSGGGTLAHYVADATGVELPRWVWRAALLDMVDAGSVKMWGQSERHSERRKAATKKDDGWILYPTTWIHPNFAASDYFCFEFVDR